MQVPRSLIGVLAGHLRTARQTGAIERDIDPDKEATILVAVVAGLASSVLTGNHTADEANAIVDYALGQLFQSD